MIKVKWRDLNEFDSTCRKYSKFRLINFYFFHAFDCIIVVLEIFTCRSIFLYTLAFEEKIQVKGRFQVFRRRRIRCQGKVLPSSPGGCDAAGRFLVQGCPLRLSGFGGQAGFRVKAHGARKKAHGALLKVSGLNSAGKL